METIGNCNENEKQPTIRVIGVGGGGCNMVGRMREKLPKGYSFVVIDSDSYCLERSRVPVVLHISTKEFKDENGEQSTAYMAAMADLEGMKEVLLFDGKADIAVIAACIGGEFGTQVAPLVAETAKEIGMMTVGILTLPSVSGGELSAPGTSIGVSNMYLKTDATIIMNNQHMMNKLTAEALEELMCCLMKLYWHL